MNVNLMVGKIIYFGDPMCSWCYGFAPHITKVKSHYKDVLDFQLVMGGLRPGGTEKIGEMGSFLRHHWEEVNNRSHQPFNYDILSRSDFVYDTEPPCRAVVSVRELDPALEFDFYKAVQEGFYNKGLDTNDEETYSILAGNFGIDIKEFRKIYTSPSTKIKTEKDFKYSQQLGIRGFPTTVLEWNGQLHLLSNGYLEADSIIPLIDKLLNPEK